MKLLRRRQPEPEPVDQSEEWADVLRRFRTRADRGVVRDEYKRAARQRQAQAVTPTPGESSEVGPVPSSTGKGDSAVAPEQFTPPEPAQPRRDLLGENWAEYDASERAWRAEHGHDRAPHWRFG